MYVPARESWLHTSVTPSHYVCNRVDGATIATGSGYVSERYNELISMFSTFLAKTCTVELT